MESGVGPVARHPPPVKVVIRTLSGEQIKGGRGSYPHQSLDMFFDTENDSGEILINSSINGTKAFLEKNATKDLLSWIADRLEKIDSDSLIQGSLWNEELSHYDT
ncbi:hypothetical protein D3C71_1711530 [compost metagenome]